MKNHLRKLGFIVNPIAGMGGRVGLKGTNGKDILQKARELGAESEAPARARETLEVLVKAKDTIQLITYPYEMGGDEAVQCGFLPTIIGSIISGKTTATDTTKAVFKMINLKVDLILFVGGDGTARDIYGVAERNVPVLGVPAGVKIHSAVFAINPKAAAVTAIKFLSNGLPIRESEVMDIDEKAFREGQVSARLYGYMLTPYEPTFIQGIKIASPITETEVRNQAAIALYIIEEMKNDIIYIIGPGTTTRTIADLLDEKKTLLGVDLFYNKKILAKDVNESKILRTIKGKRAQIIVTPIGGQGFIFGRGNLQISPKVIEEVGLDKITVIATKHKLSGLKSLKVDTGDPKLDNALRGSIKVLTDYREKQMIRID